jgi:PhnB protein
MSVKPVPEGFHTITPYFAVRDAAALLDFLKRAFDAEDFSLRAPDGSVMHGLVKVGDSPVMIGQVPKESDRPLMPAMLYMYVEDADAVYRKAIAAGGKSVLEPMDHFYGDRSGAVEDPAGNQWWIATHKEDMSEEELARRSSQRRK